MFSFVFFSLLMKVKVIQLCLALCNPMDYTVYGILQARILEWVAIPFSRRFSQTRDQTGSPTLQAGSLPAESSGKPKNTGVGSLCLLQRIFPTQELNQGLLHCRQILYQLSYQGSQLLMNQNIFTFFSHLGSLFYKLPHCVLAHFSIVLLAFFVELNKFSLIFLILWFWAV